MPKTLAEIQGFPELVRKLQQLANDKDKKAPIVAVLRKVAQGTVRVARANAPVSKRAHVVSGSRTRRVIQPGNLKKSIGVFTGKRGNARVNPTVYVGPRAKGNNDGFYGNFVEYGHNVYRTGFKRNRGGSAKARMQNAAGAKGKTAAIPFMQRTYAQTKGQVTAETEQQVVKFIQKRIDKLSTR